MEHWFLFPGFDKVAHFSVFATLGFLTIAAFPKLKCFTFFQILMSFAVLTEILQDEMHMGRAMEFLDVVADTLGFLAGYALYRLLLNAIGRRRKIKGK
ncbi:VanZ family protein [Elizabethkingia argenteiflava]|nr:VanZ family protein [Elizabethkingia argenteiflava]